MSEANIIKLSNVRLSFPHIFEPRTLTNEDGSTRLVFEAEYIYDVGGENEKLVDAAIQQAAIEKWKDDGPTIVKGLSVQNRLAQRVGDHKISNKTGKVYDGYEGKTFIKASAKVTDRPHVLTSAGHPLSQADVGTNPEAPESGDYVDAIVSFWAQDHPKGGRRVNCNLLGVIFRAKGESFSTAQRADLGDIYAAAGIEPPAEVTGEQQSEGYGV